MGYMFLLHRDKVYGFYNVYIYAASSLILLMFIYSFLTPTLRRCSDSVSVLLDDAAIFSNSHSLLSNLCFLLSTDAVPVRDYVLVAEDLANFFEGTTFGFGEEEVDYWEIDDAWTNEYLGKGQQNISGLLLVVEGMLRRTR